MHITCPYLPDLLTTRLSTGPQQMTHGYTWTSLESRGEASKTMWATHVRHAKLCQTVPKCASVLCPNSLRLQVRQLRDLLPVEEVHWFTLMHCSAMQCKMIRNLQFILQHRCTTYLQNPTQLQDVSGFLVALVYADMFFVSVFQSIIAPHDSCRHL